MKHLLIIILMITVLAVAGFVTIKYVKLFKHMPHPLLNRSSVRIEIINCSGIDKAGSRTQEFLRSVGFDVYDVQSGKRMIDKTTIIERVNPELKNALSVKESMVYEKPRLLPIPIMIKKIYPEVQKDIDSLLYLEVTIVLGKDCEKFLPKPKLIY